MELAELLDALRAVPTWAQVVSALYTVYVFVTGNCSLLKRFWQGACWSFDKARVWYRTPSRATVALERAERAEQQTARIWESVEHLRASLGEKPRSGHWPHQPDEAKPTR